MTTGNAVAEDRIMKLWDQLLIVAGHPRGGTSWVGAVLAESGRTDYIFEPLNLRLPPPTPYVREVRAYHWLERRYLSPNGEEELFPIFGKSLLGQLKYLVQHYLKGRQSLLWLTYVTPFWIKCSGVYLTMSWTTRV